ncbi:hypothetical protein DVL14_17890 [Escherichia coli]|uniref:Uncharacterized protein n=1 Tax=Escherichia coli TaxID=562 RepID=A0A2K3TT82_ECOLX|nr:hypothetical protein [Escherichia coli]OKV04710.1 hypothetical protein AWP53_02180 [Escherichia coli]OKV49424.1 hypothetical protein AWP62_25705 [Escherichia coli]PNY67492.1 hypothetical protein C2M16_13025 [Escherichia coli]
MLIYGRIWPQKNCIFLRTCCLRWTVFRENNEYTKGKDAFPFCFFFNGMECICLSPGFAAG